MYMDRGIRRQGYTLLQKTSLSCLRLLGPCLDCSVWAAGTALVIRGDDVVVHGQEGKVTHLCNHILVPAWTAWVIRRDVAGVRKIEKGPIIDVLPGGIRNS